MSRYTATIRMTEPGEPLKTGACDSIHVDDSGDLHLQRVQHPGKDLLTVARIQHGHWSSYELEPSDDADAEEQLRLGAITLHEFARRILGEPDADDSADVPVQAETLPEVGATVHVVERRGEPGCSAMRVSGHLGGAGLLLEDVLLLATPIPFDFAARTHDETRTEPCAWHWPCNGDDHDAEPEPDAPTPMTIHVNLHGSHHMTDRDIETLASRIAIGLRTGKTNVHIQA